MLQSKEIFEYEMVAITPDSSDMEEDDDEEEEEEERRVEDEIVICPLYTLPLPPSPIQPVDGTREMSLDEYRNAPKKRLSQIGRRKKMEIYKTVYALIEKRRGLWKETLTLTDTQWEEIGVELFLRIGVLLGVKHLRSIWEKGKRELKRKLEKCIVKCHLNVSLTEQRLMEWNLYKYIRFYRHCLQRFEDELREQNDGALSPNEESAKEAEDVGDDVFPQSEPTDCREAACSTETDDEQLVSTETGSEEELHEQHVEQVAGDIMDHGHERMELEPAVEEYHFEELVLMDQAERGGTVKNDCHSLPRSSESHQHLLPTACSSEASEVNAPLEQRTASGEDSSSISGMPRANVKQEAVREPPRRPATPLPAKYLDVTLDEYLAMEKKTKGSRVGRDGSLKKVVLDVLGKHPAIWKSGTRYVAARWQNVGAEVYCRTGRVLSVNQLRQTFLVTKKQLKRRLTLCITGQKLDREHTEKELWNWEYYRHFHYYRQCLGKFEATLRGEPWNGEDESADDDDDIIFDGYQDAEQDFSFKSTAPQPEKEEEEDEEEGAAANVVGPSDIDVSEYIEEPYPQDAMPPTSDALLAHRFNVYREPAGAFRSSRRAEQHYGSPYIASESSPSCTISSDSRSCLKRRFEQVESDEMEQSALHIAEQAKRLFVQYPERQSVIRAALLKTIMAVEEDNYQNVGDLFEDLAEQERFKEARRKRQRHDREVRDGGEQRRGLQEDGAGEQQLRSTRLFHSGDLKTQNN